MVAYSLCHDLTNSANMKGFLDAAPENNGAMMSAVEKLRFGGQPPGETKCRVASIQPHKPPYATVCPNDRYRQPHGNRGDLRP